MAHIQSRLPSLLKDQVINVARRMLGPIVRILLRNGIGWREFEELGKEVFVEIARRDYGLQGRPTNVARVSMMTGMSRREVTRIRDIVEGRAPQPQPATSRISTVLSGWHLDPEFIDAGGGPAVLPETGSEGSLEALLDRYAGDLPHGAFIKELTQLGLVARVKGGFRVVKRDYVRRASDPDQLDQAGVAFEDHGTTLAFNCDSTRGAPARFERMATTLRLDRRHLQEFHALVERKGQALLEELDAWLGAHTADSGAEQKQTVRAGLGMYVIQDETERNRK